VQIVPDFTASPAFEGNIVSLLRQTAQSAILPYFQNLQNSQITTKTSATDFVTIADKQAERALISGLRSLLPEADFIAEEMHSLSGKPSVQTDKAYIWTIDPLDGTRNFVKGDHQFCMMIGLLKHGWPIWSCIYHPLKDEAVIAKQDRTVYLIGSDNQRVSCQPRRNKGPLSCLSGSLNAMGFPPDIRDRVRQRLKQLKGRFHAGSAGIDAMNIACAKSDYLMHSKLTFWDSVPVVMTLTGLGYYIRMAPDGGVYQPGQTGILIGAANRESWQEIVNYIWSDL
jgi:fructose-1,6-bisphosphatase/inositol monophosphatase family enzyme